MRHLDTEWTHTADSLMASAGAAEGTLASANSEVANAGGGFIGDLAGPHGALTESVSDADRSLVSAVLGAADGVSAANSVYLRVDDENGRSLTVCTSADSGAPNPAAAILPGDSRSLNL